MGTKSQNQSLSKLQHKSQYTCSHEANGSWFMNGLRLGSVRKEEGVLNPNSFERFQISIDLFKLILSPEVRKKYIPQFLVSTVC